MEYFCDDELAEQPEPDKWQRGTLITTPGIPLRLSGMQAEECQLANHLVENFAQFKQYYGLENDPVLVEPGWADFLIQALASPGVAVLLLVIGGAALYVELHAPGMGVGGFVAAICFLLFFWSRYLGGTAGWLEVSLFVAGVSCLLLEIFVIPGFGIFGLGGGVLVLASLILASQTFVWPQNEYQFDQLERSLLTILAAGMGLILVAYFLRKRLPRSPLLGRMMLEPPAGEEAETIRRRESLVDFHELVGDQRNDHHAAYARRQGPLRRHAGRRDRRRRGDRPRHGHRSRRRAGESRAGAESGARGVAGPFGAAEGDRFVFSANVFRRSASFSRKTDQSPTGP